jgi:SAM-dependent MidA family methyltransferase
LNLQEKINSKILNNPLRSISYYEYMKSALYDPDFGYYSRPVEKIGKQGDFYTSSSVGSVFGETISDVFMEMIQALPDDIGPCLIEFGGGTGEFMYQVLQEWKRVNPSLLGKTKIVMIEKSPFHRQKQQEKLAGFAVLWYEEWELFLKDHQPIQAVIFSNELLDAFPVYIVEKCAGSFREVRITWNEKTGQFEEVYGDVSCPEVLDFLHKEQNQIPNIEGYRVEVNLDALHWLHSITDGLQAGFVVTIDYGFLRSDFFIPERRKGSLLCYKSHQVFDDPLADPGKMDMTTHVQFSPFMEEGENHGLTTLGFYTQSEFLINAGILDKLQSHDDKDPFHGVLSKRNRSIRQLIMPGGMGETFKVLVQKKGNFKARLAKLEKKGWV